VASGTIATIEHACKWQRDKIGREGKLAAASMEEHWHDARQGRLGEANRTRNITQPETCNLAHMPGVFGMIAADLVASVRLVAAEVKAVEDRLLDFQATANGALRALSATQ
jgi:hypothetical protein